MFFDNYREKLARALFPEVFKDVVYYKDRELDWKYKFFTLEREMDNFKKVFEGLKGILEREMDEQCKLVFDKENFPVIMAISGHRGAFRGDEVFMIRVISPVSEGRHDLLVNLTLYHGEKMVIDDIQGGYDRGYGSLALQEVIRISRQQGLKCVTGMLCNEDLKDHRERLEHFYGKFGFVVKVEEQPGGYLSGSVHLDLEKTGQ